LASAFITTAYYDEAPLDEYGMFSPFSTWVHIANIEEPLLLCDWLCFCKQVWLGNQNGDILRNYMLQSSHVHNLYFMELKPHSS
jgi:hypothetical protein